MLSELFKQLTIKTQGMTERESHNYAWSIIVDLKYPAWIRSIIYEQFCKLKARDYH